MKNSKYGILTLGVIMAVNNAAIAESGKSRVSVATEAAIADVKSDISNLSADLLTLDKSLSDLSSQVLQRDRQGTITGGVAVGAAAVSLGLGYVGYKLLGKRAEGSSLGGLAFALTSTMAGGASAVASLSSATLQSGVEVDEYLNQLEGLQKQVDRGAAQSANQAKPAMTELSRKIGELREEVKAYKRDANITRNAKIYGSMAQILGMAATIGAINSASSSGVLNLGPMMVLAGNIAQVATVLTDAEADEVILAIESLRASVRLAVQALNNEK